MNSTGRLMLSRFNQRLFHRYALNKVADYKLKIKPSNDCKYFDTLLIVSGIYSLGYIWYLLCHPRYG